MTDDLKPLPDQEPMRTDWFITQLGNSQQKVMSLTVQNRALKKRAKAAEERVEILEELVMGVAADLYDGVSASKIDQRIGDVMKKLDEEQPDD